MMRKGGKRIIALCVALVLVFGTLWGTGFVPTHGSFVGFFAEGDNAEDAENVDLDRSEDESLEEEEEAEEVAEVDEPETEEEILDSEEDETEGEDFFLKRARQTMGGVEPETEAENSEEEAEAQDQELATESTVDDTEEETTENATESTGTPTEETVAGEDETEATEVVPEEPAEAIEEQEPAEEQPEEQQPEEQQTTTMPEGSLSTTTAGGIVVSASFGENVFPEGVGMQATDLSKEEAMDAAADAVEGEVVDAAGADITFYDADGNEVEPYEGGEVNVSLTLGTPLEDGELTVVHIDDAGNAEELAGSDVDEITENGATFTATEFSSYVTVTYKDPEDSSYDFYIEVKTDEAFDYSYDGTAKKPIVYAMTPNWNDYSHDARCKVEYENNVNAGTATAKITVAFYLNSQNVKTVTQTYDFEITPADLSKATVEVANCTYNGKEQKPEVTVTYNGKHISSDNYDVAYANNINAGTGTVTVTGKGGNFSGTKTANFTINKLSLSQCRLKLDKSSYYVYEDEETKKPKVTLTYGWIVPEENYIVTYTLPKSIGEATATVTAKGDNLTGNPLKATYYIKAGGTIEADGIEWSKESHIYNGTTQKLESITVKKQIDKDTVVTLVEGTDYSVSYSNNINAGEATDANAPTVTVKGKGGYSGEVKHAFTIERKDISSVNIPKVSESYNYDGTAKTLDITLTDGEKTLKEGVDYSVTYSDNISAGDVTATITGKGNYTGKTSVGYTIDKANLANSEVSLSQNTYTYDGKAKTPTATVEWNGRTLVQGTDYNVKYDNNENASTDEAPATVTISGTETGNFDGKQTKNFWIEKASLSDCTLSMEQTILAYTGSAQTPTITVKDRAGNKLTGDTDYIVEYSNNTKVGTATVTVTGKGNYEGTKKTNFSIIGTTFSVTLDENKYTYDYDGASHMPKVIVKNEETPLTEGTDYTVSYNSGDYVHVGTKTVTVTGKGSYIRAGTQIVRFTIVPKSVSSLEVTLSKDSFDYIGKAITPGVTVTDQLGNLTKTLNKGMDYTVEYSNNINVGTATMTIIGMGNYTGKIEKEFTIKAVELSSCILSPIPSEYTYDGEAKKPKVTVTNSTQTVKLTEGTDYTVDYGPNLVDAGTKTVTVTAIGNNYIGNKSGTFTIKPADISGSEIILSNDIFKETGSEIKPYVTVLFNGERLWETESYTLTYSNNTNVGPATVTVTGKGNYEGEKSADFHIIGTDFAVTLNKYTYTYDGEPKTPTVTVMNDGKKLTAGTDYTVKYINNIDAGKVGDEKAPTVTVTGIGSYNGVERTVRFTIVGRSISDANIKLEKDSYTYDGGEKEPNVTVTDDEVKTQSWLPWVDDKLARGTDYDVAYSNNRDVGTATVTVKGKGNYTGSVSKDFTIAQKSIADANISLSGNITYNGTEQTPTITVTVDGQSLTRDKDYTPVFSRNIDAGTAVVTIQGKGNYTGVAEKSFQIEQAKLDTNKCELLLNTEPTYDGSPKEPEITVTYDGRKLTQNKDYTVSYSNNINAGKATEANAPTVTVTGKGNYTGKIPKEFTIKQADISGSQVELEQYTYTFEEGVKREPKVTVTYNGIELNKDGKQDYTVSYEDNEKAGVGKVIISGTGNYFEKKTETFVINATELKGSVVLKDGDNVIDKDNPYTYDGTQKKPDVTVTVKVTTETETETETEKVLTKDTDYTVAYGANINAGTGTVIIEGKNSYKGKGIVTFPINPRPIEGDDSIFITLSDTEYTYDGTEKKPAVTIADGTDILTEGTDYAVAYSNNKDVGTATVTVTGNGNYKGTKITSFTIETADISGSQVELSQYTYEYTGGTIEPTVEKVTYNGMTLTKGTDYDVAYSNNINAGQAGDANAPTVTITGKGNYSGAKTETFVINKIELQGDFVKLFADADKKTSITDETYSYGGEEKKKKPTVTVTCNGKSLSADDDYIVTYKDNIDAGNGTVVVTGKGNYTGTVTKTFKINPAELGGHNTILLGSYPEGFDITKTELWDEASYYFAYDGTEKTPEATVFYFDNANDILNPDKLKKLVRNVDYTVRYSNNVNITDDAWVTITGTGNYTGTAETTFHIEGKDFAATTTISLPKNATYIYNGEEITPKVTVINKEDGKELNEGTDFKAAYFGNDNAGTASVIVYPANDNYKSGTGNMLDFTIEPLDLSVSNVTMKLEQDVYKCDYTKKKPEVTVTYDGNVISSDDYTVSYANNIFEGTATATITGVAPNCEKSQTLTFTITKAGEDISNADITVSPDTYTYTGTAKTPEVVVTIADDESLKDSITLKEGEDYTVEYSNNVNVGTAVVTVKGMDGYYGEKTATFTITEKESSRTSSSSSGSSANSSVSTTTTKHSSSSSSTDDTYSAGSKGSKASYVVKGKKSVRYDLCMVSNKKKTAKVPAKVKIDKKTYKVTAVSSYAFPSNENLTSVIIGKNVKRIGKNAFSGCTNLKTLTIKSRMLTAKGVKNCLKDSSVETIIVPDGTEKVYAKLFAKENSGRGKAVKIITASQAAKKK